MARQISNANAAAPSAARAQQRENLPQRDKLGQRAGYGSAESAEPRC